MNRPGLSYAILGAIALTVTALSAGIGMAEVTHPVAPALRSSQGRISPLPVRTRRASFGRTRANQPPSRDCNEGSDGGTGSLHDPNGDEYFIGVNSSGQTRESNDAVLAGASNVVCGNQSAIAAGNSDFIDDASQQSFIGAGEDEYVDGELDFVGAGEFNTGMDSSTDSGITSGTGNIVIGSGNFIGAGNGNTTNNTYSAIAGGNSNNATGSAAFVGAGTKNVADNTNSAVAGGSSNTAGGVASFVGGGSGNNASDSYDAIGGGQANSITGNGSFIGAGGSLSQNNCNNTCPSTSNSVSGTDSFIGAGDAIAVESNGSFVGSGASNVIGTSATFSAIGSGDANTIGSEDAFIGSGLSNAIGTSASYSSIAGGKNNAINAAFGSVLGGYANVVSGKYATVLGGYATTASGTLSLAGGYHASATHNGSFVWSDYGSGSAIVSDSAANQFVVRSSGGVTLYSNEGMTSGVKLGAGSGAWANLSDRNAKIGIATLDDASILAKVAALPVSEWSYKSESGVKHVGPMAQDFYSAFGIGEDDRHITSIDEDGVALAAIKALDRDNGRLHLENVSLRSENAQMHAMLEKILANQRTTAQRLDALSRSRR